MRLVALLSVVLLLVACGGDDGSPGDEAAAPAAAARDSIVIRSLGIDAPLTLKRLQVGVALASPDGADDVAIYEFGLAQFGGSPGAGNVVMAARSLSEVACKGGAEPAPCKGAFFELGSVPLGERVDVTWQGASYRYQVVSICNVAARNFGDSLYWRTSTEQLTLLTGIGELGQAGFSHLLIVIAKREPVTSSEPCPEGTKTGPTP